MECEKYSVSCRLEEISAAIASPTIFEILTFAVSSLAAIGTLAIAWMNFRLISRQHRLEEDVAKTQARIRRESYASRLNDELGAMMASMVSGLEWNLVDRLNQWTELNRLGSATGERSWKKLNGCLMRIVMASEISPKNPQRWFEIQTILSERSTAWVEDPMTADFGIPLDIEKVAEKMSPRDFLA